MTEKKNSRCNGSGCTGKKRRRRNLMKREREDSRIANYGKGRSSPVVYKDERDEFPGVGALIETKPVAFSRARAAGQSELFSRESSDRMGLRETDQETHYATIPCITLQTKCSGPGTQATSSSCPSYARHCVSLRSHCVTLESRKTRVERQCWVGGKMVLPLVIEWMRQVMDIQWLASRCDCCIMCEDTR